MNFLPLKQAAQALAVILFSIWLPQLQASPIVFTNLTRQLQGAFFSFSQPSIDKSDVVFLGGGGVGGGYFGVLLYHSGHLDNVVRTFDQPVPQSPGYKFDNFYGTPSIYSGTIAFLAHSQNSAGGSVDGIYTENNGILSLVADTNTHVPGGAGNFSSFSSPLIQGNDIVFYGQDSLGIGGIYAKEGDTLIAVASTTTAAPSGEGFTGFGIYPSVSNGTVAFLGSTPTRSGIYEVEIGTNQPVRSVVDSTSPVTKDAAFFSPMISNGEVVFFAGAAPGGSGIFAYSPDSNAITRVSPPGQSFPGDSDSGFPSIDHGLIAYYTNGEIFTNLDSFSPKKLIGMGEQIDPNGDLFVKAEPSFHQAADRETSSIAFVADYGVVPGFIQGQDIFVATLHIPEPGTLALMVIAIVGFGFSRRPSNKLGGFVAREVTSSPTDSRGV